MICNGAFLEGAMQLSRRFRKHFRWMRRHRHLHHLRPAAALLGPIFEPELACRFAFFSFVLPAWRRRDDVPTLLSPVRSLLALLYEKSEHDLRTSAFAHALYGNTTSATSADRSITSCCSCITRRAPGAAHIRTASALHKRTAPARGPARGPATTASGGFTSRYEQSNLSSPRLYLAAASSC